jgi:hypothetical protein
MVEKCVVEEGRGSGGSEQLWLLFKELDDWPLVSMSRKLELECRHYGDVATHLLTEAQYWVSGKMQEHKSNSENTGDFF